MKPLRKEAEKYYFFSDFAASLNEMEDGVAPTDSRLRPDQRLMEEGRWDEANTEKVIIKRIWLQTKLQSIQSQLY